VDYTRDHRFELDKRHIYLISQATIFTVGLVALQNTYRKHNDDVAMVSTINSLKNIAEYAGIVMKFDSAGKARYQESVLQET
jgi:hypothetical protein